MKIKFNESDFSTWIDLEAETPEEAAKLLRMANNSKNIPPSVHCDFFGENIRGHIYLKKINKNVQVNSINNKQKKR